ncbi:MAG: multidrug ABC transporter permease [Rhodospirillaceae bacterium]|nr:multidrug ABC transporter permease [Rhodospirillaceae bacterium]|tara:strand:- start:210 stop:1001 length:792 start_codon:yes stop_codon:yes gene_type:complete
MAIAPREIGAVNWIGVRTMYSKEVHRFVKVIGQTVLAPVVTTLLFLAIFSLALANRVGNVNGGNFLEFLAPGLIMMAIVQNAFANTSSSVMIAKVQGNIVDVLMPPLSAGELVFCYVMGGVTRGLVVGVVTGLAMAIVVDLSPSHVLATIFFAAAASTLLSLIGLITGIWADKFDQMAAVTNFVITPLAFLSGTFYSIDRLPGFWHHVAQWNPFFYMIDGFRYSFIDHADGNLLVGACYLLAANTVLWFLSFRILSTGYKLKA